jgi:hypothetical protein
VDLLLTRSTQNVVISGIGRWLLCRLHCGQDLAEALWLSLPTRKLGNAIEITGTNWPEYFEKRLARVVHQPQAYLLFRLGRFAPDEPRNMRCLWNQLLPCRRKCAYIYISTRSLKTTSKRTGTNLQK